MSSAEKTKSHFKVLFWQSESCVISQIIHPVYIPVVIVHTCEAKRNCRSMFLLYKSKITFWFSELLMAICQYVCQWFAGQKCSCIAQEKVFLWYFRKNKQNTSIELFRLKLKITHPDIVIESASMPPHPAPSLILEEKDGLSDNHKICSVS